MGILIDGQWSSDMAGAAHAGAVRKNSGFTGRIAAEPGARFPAVPGRYHLYVSRACPWCHRVMLFRILKNLEDFISISYVEPLTGSAGWAFGAPDPVTGADYVYQLYQRADPHYSGRATVPVLWDKQTQTIVSSESADILRMLNTAFSGQAAPSPDYYPLAAAAEIDAVNQRIQASVNTGVYKVGMAVTEAEYAAAAAALFGTLEWLEERLGNQRYLVGNFLTEADWRLFPSLVRFDAVYYGLFKCNLNHLYDFPALWDYTRELYRMPGIAGTVDLDECKRHFYGSLRALNPTGIVPLGPRLDFSRSAGAMIRSPFPGGTAVTHGPAARSA